MADGIHIHGKVRKVGNSLALLIPAAAARKAGLHEGDGVDAELRMTRPTALGLLADLPYEPFTRDGLYDDD